MSNTVTTHIAAAVAAVLIATVSFIPVITVPQADYVAVSVTPELA